MLASQIRRAMLKLITVAVMQRGPMGGHMGQLDYGSVIVATALIVIVAVAVMLLMFPRLQNITSTESIRPVVEIQEEEAPAGSEDEDEDDRTMRGVEVAMRLLEPDEKRVVETLAAAGGTMLQKDISHETGYSRVKTHRVLVRLIRRGVVTAEKYYNTNRIEIADWLWE